MPDILTNNPFDHIDSPLPTVANGPFNRVPVFSTMGRGPRGEKGDTLLNDNNVIPIENGGTEASTATAALANLGAASRSDLSNAIEYEHSLIQDITDKIDYGSPSTTGNTIQAQINALRSREDTSNFFKLVHSGCLAGEWPGVAAGGNIIFDTDDYTTPSGLIHNIYIVAVGPWKYAGLYVVYPNNFPNNDNQEPVVQLISKRENDPTVTFEIASNGGIKMTNVSTNQVPYSIFALSSLIPLAPV